MQVLKKNQNKTKKKKKKKNKEQNKTNTNTNKNNRSQMLRPLKAPIPVVTNKESYKAHKP